ncbi:MAG: hypothetical protein FWE95_08480 [Planctomycetaceae bacterium]|nr:hypothetical protein [Planctomycetaceae bacterium]
MAKKAEFNKEALMKYLFWAGTPIGLVVAVLAGMMAIGSIAKELNDQKQTLDGQKQSMNQLRGAASTHPNQGTIDAIKEAQEKLATNVFTAWETLVLDQQERNLWPGLADVAQNEILSKNFLDDLSSSTRDSYLLFARGEMDKLGGMQKRRNQLDDSDLWRVQLYRQDGQPVEILRLTENAGTNTGFGGIGGSPSGGTGQRPTAVVTGPTIQSGKVVWDNPALNVTMKDWQNLPQSFEVWLTQEDLWVYQALLWVVAESNKDVREASKTMLPGASGGGVSSGTSTPSGAGGDPLNLRESVVKEIIQLSIGRSAAIPLDQQTRRRISSGSGSMSGDSSAGLSGDSSGSSLGGGFGSDSSSSGLGGSSEGGMATMSPAAMAEAMRKAAMAGRYVDAEGKPLMEPDLTSQFRRMPVLLELRVDQRYISDVLVNCANCPMPIDVLWVTVSPDNTQQFNYAPTASTGQGMSGGQSGGMGAGRRSGGGGGSLGGSQGRVRGGMGTTNVDYGPNEVTIEILGCINIFAPPEKEKIGGGGI